MHRHHGRQTLRWRWIEESVWVKAQMTQTEDMDEETKLHVMENELADRWVEEARW